MHCTPICLLPQETYSHSPYNAPTDSRQNVYDATLNYIFLSNNLYLYRVPLLIVKCFIRNIFFFLGKLMRESVAADWYFETRGLVIWRGNGHSGHANMTWKISLLALLRRENAELIFRMYSDIVKRKLKFTVKNKCFFI